MERVKRLILIVLLVLPTIALAGTPIRGEVVVDSATMARFVARHNPDFDPEIARAFFEVGERYGIRGDIALCQAVIETGWFRFEGGTAVTPDQHNYCGLGVTKKGRRGCSFDTVEKGVTAMIQHLYAYATTDPLPEGEELVDPRFDIVERGVAPDWDDLSGRWAANPVYHDLIFSVYDKLQQLHESESPSQPYYPDFLEIFH